MSNEATQRTAKLARSTIGQTNFLFRNVATAHSSTKPRVAHVMLTLVFVCPYLCAGPVAYDVLNARYGRVRQSSLRAGSKRKTAVIAAKLAFVPEPRYDLRSVCYHRIHETRHVLPWF